MLGPIVYMYITLYDLVLCLQIAGLVEDNRVLDQERHGLAEELDKVSMRTLCEVSVECVCGGGGGGMRFS